MLRNVFTINLNHKIVGGKVCLGRFDGKNYCIVAVVSSDKILIHNPYTKLKAATASSSTQQSPQFSAISSELNILNINQNVNSISCGRLVPNQEQDVLAVGTPSSILIYDVLNNTDVFYHEIPDGANAVVVGELGTQEKPLAIVGGNCALQGFDHEGNDAYWTVTGDNVTSVCLCDLSQDGQNKLIVGSEGNEIRIFKEDAILFDLQETDAIKCICYLARNCFAYALRNGTVGVYQNRERLWRIKSKNEVIALAAYDVNGDGQFELITGWSSGKVDARLVHDGEVLYKEQLKQRIAGLLVADYDQDGRDELLIVAGNGEVRGLQSTAKNEAPSMSGALLPEEAAQLRTRQQQRLTQLMRRKHQLSLELRSYESRNQIADQQKFFAEEDLRARARPSRPDEAFTTVPTGTQIKSTLMLHLNDKFNNKGGVDLCLHTTNDTIVRAAAVFAEGIFKGESYLMHPSDAEVSNMLTLSLRPLKNMAIDLHIKALVGYPGSYHFHAFELTRYLPRFSMIALLSTKHSPQPAVPAGNAVYQLHEKSAKLIWWINRNFLISEETRPEENESGQLVVDFLCLRTGSPIRLQLDEQAAEMRFACDDMSLAGELLQSFASECLTGQPAGNSLNCVATFPDEMTRLKQLIGQVEQLQTVRQQLAADLADSSGYVKTLVVKAEDARLLYEFKLMRQRYVELHQLNKELIGNYRVGAQNQQALVDALKQINGIIQKAANLRYGTCRMQIIQSCRNAIRQNNLNILTRIIATGET